MEEAARKEVESFEKGHEALVEEMWKRINAANKATLKHQYDSNMLSKKQYEKVRDMFKYYVPLRGFADATAEDMYQYYRSDQRNSFTPPLLKAAGRKTEAASPFAYIGSMASSAIAADVKNETKLALYYFVSNRPNDLVSISDVWYKQTGVDENGKRIFTPVYPDFNKDLSSEDAKKALEDWEKMMQEEEKAGFAYKGTRKLDLHNSVIHIDDRQVASHIIRFKVGGQEMMMYINGNPRAAQALNNELNIEMSNVYRNFFGKILRYFSGINTSYNPEFWLSNAQRDALFALMSVNVKEDAGYGKRFRKNFANLVAKTIIPKIKGGVYSMKKALADGKIGDSEIENYYSEFVENGGVTGYTLVKKTEEYDSEIRKALAVADDSEKPIIKKVGARLGDVFGKVMDFGESVEQMTRFAAYLTSRQIGKGIKDAVNDAKELTVNFNRKGSGQTIGWEETGRLRRKDGKKLNTAERLFSMFASMLPTYGRSAIMFFNASVQGLNAMVKLYKKNGKKMAAWTVGYAVLGAMNAILHAMLDGSGDDDDERKDDYLEIPDYERRNNLLVGFDGVYLRWALPQEARVFYSIGDIAVNHLMDRTPDKSILGESLDAALDVAPLNPAGGLSAVVPSYMTMFVEAGLPFDALGWGGTNKDFKGARIYDEKRFLSDSEKKHIPGHQKALKGTSSIYVDGSEFINAMTGGDYAKKGWVSPNPGRVQHYVESITGGAGTTLEKMMETGLAIAGKDQFQVRNTPFLRRLLTITDERSSYGRANELYYYYKDVAEEAGRLHKEYVKAGDKDRQHKLEETSDYRIYEYYKDFSKAEADYNKRLKKCEDPVEEERLNAEKAELHRRFVEIARKL